MKLKWIFFIAFVINLVAFNYFLLKSNTIGSGYFAMQTNIFLLLLVGERLKEEIKQP